MRNKEYFLIIIGMVFWGSQISFAQPIQPTEEEIIKAKEIFAKAQQHYNLQEYVQALEGYKNAYRLSNKPEMLFNIGQCYRHLKQLEEAVKSYEAYLREGSYDHDRKLIIEELVREVKEEIENPTSPDSLPLSLSPNPIPDTNDSTKTPDISSATPNTIPAISDNTSFTKKPFPVVPVLYGAAVGWGILGGITGMVALSRSASIKQSTQNDTVSTEAIQAQIRQTRRIGLVADIFIGLSIAHAVGAFVIKKKKSKVDVSISPSQATLNIRF